MIESLRTIRLSRMQLGVVALLSAAATGLVIASALGHTPAQKAVLAALRHRPMLVRFTGSDGNGGTASTSDTSPPVSSAAPLAAAAPTAPSQPAAGGNTGNTGTAGNTGAGTTTTTQTTTRQTTTAAAPKTHKIHHVFVVGLTTTGFGDTFGTTSVAHYLNDTLVPQGAVLGGYETLGPTPLPDYLGLISGQAPNADTKSGCVTYAEFPSNAKPGSDGQVPGAGCVYPNTIVTLADQVASDGKTWKGYIEDMGTQSCIHPNSDAVDNTVLPFAGTQYATRHNPFIYFHSLLDLGGCSSNDVSIDRLAKDLRTTSTTPTVSYIAPRACDEAGTATCPDGKPAGLAGEDAFLKHWIPEILASPAYKQDGVIVIAFALGAAAHATGGSAPTGALVLSRYAKRGTTISATYNPYSVLASIETLLGYDRLAHAKGATTFLATALPSG